MIGQPRAVGGQGQFVQAMTDQTPDPVDQFAHVAPDQGLAAGQADLGNPARDEAFGDDRNLLHASNALRGRKVIASPCNTTAEIAAIGDGDAQIADGTAMRIDQRGLGRDSMVHHRCNALSRTGSVASRDCLPPDVKGRKKVSMSDTHSSGTATILRRPSSAARRGASP